MLSAVALVTGAGSGIGKAAALALALAREGFEIEALGHTQQRRAPITGSPKWVDGGQGLLRSWQLSFKITGVMS